MHKNCSTCGLLAWKVLTFACGRVRQKDCSLKGNVKWCRGRLKWWSVTHQVWPDVAHHAGGSWGGGAMLQVSALCAFLCGSVQLGTVFRFTHVSAYKCEICVMLTLFPNLSGMMEYIHIVKVGVPEELTRTILKYLSPVSWHYGTRS